VIHGHPLAPEEAYFYALQAAAGYLHKVNVEELEVRRHAIYSPQDAQRLRDAMDMLAEELMLRGTRMLEAQERYVADLAKLN
jgi:hypothetical protein